jgi:hypothetical protein
MTDQLLESSSRLFEVGMAMLVSPAVTSLFFGPVLAFMVMVLGAACVGVAVHRDFKD